MTELEHTMGVNEAREWAEYLSKEPSNAIEIQLALLTSVVGNMMGGKSKTDDFLITAYKAQRDESQQFASEEAVANALMALATA